MIDVPYIKELINTKNIDKLAAYMKANNLVIKGNKIVGSAENVSQATEYWDKRQLVRKILLNSALMFGALV
jgi:lipoate-protein ligase A